MCGTNVKLRFAIEVIVELAQLWNPPFEVELPLELHDMFLVGLAHTLLVQLSKPFVAISPDAGFFICILDQWNRLANYVQFRQAGDLVSTFPVFCVLELHRLTTFLLLHI